MGKYSDRHIVIPRHMRSTKQDEAVRKGKIVSCGKCGRSYQVQRAGKCPRCGGRI